MILFHGRQDQVEFILFQKNRGVKSRQEIAIPFMLEVMLGNQKDSLQELES
jgi:hypothetical protein